MFQPGKLAVAAQIGKQTRETSFHLPREAEVLSPPAEVPDTMQLQAPSFSAQRRSERLSLAFPVEVEGIDISGNRFCDRTRTTTVSRFGCAVATFHLLQTDQRIHLRRVGTTETAVGRVVASIGKNSDGQVYGVGTDESCEALWGIQFSSPIYHHPVLDHQDGVYFVDRKRRITSWNDGAEQLSGYSAKDVIGRCCSENFLGHVDKSGRSLCVTGCPLTRVMQDGQPRTAEFYLQHQQGHRVPINVRVMPMKNSEGVVIGAVEIFSHADSPSTEKRVTELEHMAFYDVLTNLPNRRYLEMKVEQGLKAQKQFGRRYGLILFNLDHFGHVNETHGHKVGDALLQTIATTMAASQKKSDIVGRWGGEEFLIIMPDMDAEGLGDSAERCRVMVEQLSVAADRGIISVTASIGATVLTDEDSTESALARVDELTHHSERSGGNQTTVG